MEKKDIFERIMDWKLMRPFRPFWTAHREVLLYLLFGGLTTLVSILTFALFTIRMGINVLWGNVLSWILAVLFAFSPKFEALVAAMPTVS